jgi:ABC-type dipeptide/oligopeptide/nickel transport system ATPase subunit
MVEGKIREDGEMMRKRMEEMMMKEISLPFQHKEDTLQPSYPPANPES